MQIYIQVFCVCVYKRLSLFDSCEQMFAEGSEENQKNQNNGFKNTISNFLNLLRLFEGHTKIKILNNR